MDSTASIIPTVKFWYPRVIVYNPLQVGSIDGTDTEPHDRAILRAINAKYIPNDKVKGIPEHTVFVARLSKKTSEDILKKEFSRFGKVKRCRLVKDIVTGLSRGYAFIEYEREKDARKAVIEATNICIDGKVIFVDHECERLLPGWVPRRLGGGFGGRKESGQLRFGGKERQFQKPVLLMDNREVQKHLSSKKSLDIRK